MLCGNNLRDKAQFNQTFFRSFLLMIHFLTIFAFVFSIVRELRQHLDIVQNRRYLLYFYDHTN